ncbi:MAG: McrB family protein [Bacillota bacterium]
MFIEDFEKSNGGFHVAPGERHEVILIINGNRYDAFLTNIKRKGIDIDTLQIRYDTNNELKQLLIQELKSSYSYLTNERSKKKEENDNSKIIVPDSIAEYLDFYETETPFCYRVDIIKVSTTTAQEESSLPNVWWVNQGSTLSKALMDGCIWAPLKAKDGKPRYHWETLAELKNNDIVLHYSNGYLRYVSRVLAPAIEIPLPESMKTDNWEGLVRWVQVEYHELSPNIQLDKVSKELLKLDIKEGPIDNTGGVKQGYLFRLNLKALSIIQALALETQWPSFTRLGDKEADFISQMEVIYTFNINTEVARISNYIKSKGFTYDDNLIKNFYLALKSKPFVILAGTSGTGKSKLVKLFAEALGARVENGRYRLIPVRPDWSDSTDLLGYRDLKGNFQLGILTSFIKEAENKHEPYFICLDEMNLARVEYYLSDILSVMETRKWSGDRIVTDNLLSGEIFGSHDEARNAYGSLYIPENVYFIGTVNMDETTFPFSKKVLDRANTIEFSHVNLDFTFSSHKGDKSVNLHNNFLRSDFLILEDCIEHQDIFNRVILVLKQINDVLKKSSLHFGYRVRDEICFYMIYNEINTLMPFDEAIDYEILQKILPRIQGSSSHIKRLLLELFEICTDNNTKNFNYQDSGVSEEMFAYLESNGVKYKQSAYKIAFMVRRFEEDGFTSYWM